MILYFIQCLLFNFQTCSIFMNRHYIWPHSRKMNPQFTFSCCVEIHVYIGNKHVLCSDVYNFPRIRILLSKYFLVHRYNKKNKKKNTPWFFKGTAISVITFIFMHAHSILLAAMFVFVSTENHVLNRIVKLFNRIVFVNRIVGFFFYLKNYIFKINSVNFSYTNIFTL